MGAGKMSRVTITVEFPEAAARAIPMPRFHVEARGPGVAYVLNVVNIQTITQRPTEAEWIDLGRPEDFGKKAT